MRTHSCLPLILRVHEHTHIWCAHLQPFQECFDNTHTQVVIYWRFGWWWHTHTHLYPCPRLIAFTNTYFFFKFTGAFFSHACGDTRNFRTYFTSVRRVFLLETIVLQTVLWDIRAWGARFLVIDSIIIIRISDESAWHSLQENEVIFPKIYIFQQF